MGDVLNVDLDKIQIGLEADAGTLIPATRLVPFVEGSYESILELKEIRERKGIRATEEDVATGRGAMLDMTQELDFEHLLAALQCGFQAGDPVTDQGVSTYTFTPGVLAPVDLKTATIEVITTSGTVNRRERFGFARPTSIGIEIADDTAQLSVTWEGRAAENLAAPAAAASFARTIIPARAFKVYIDDSWAALGTTAFGSLRNMSVDYDPGLEPAYNKQGRALLDMSHWKRHRFDGSLSLSCDHDDDSNPEYDHYKARDLRFVRVEAEIGPKLIRMDHCVRWLSTPDLLDADGDQHSLELEGELRSDATAANNRYQLQLKNGIAAW